MNPQTSKQSISINLRAKVYQRDLIDQAAQRQGRSRSDFMLEAACREAEDVLLDQTFFTASEGVFKNLAALMDKPLLPTERLRRFINTKVPWDK